MDDITFMHEFIEKAKPKIPLRYAFLEEGRLMTEMDRAEQLASTAHERKRQEAETEKIMAALEKEKHDAYVEKKKNQLLMQNTDELRRLRYYVATAETTKDLVAQLKLQDEKIERRFEEAQRQAQELRAEYCVADERQRQIEEQKRLEAKILRDDLRAQMAVHDMQRAEELEEKIRDGQELFEKLRQLDERDRLQQEADAKAKVLLRQEILETLRQRQELFKIQNAKDLTTIQAQYEAQKRLDDMNQRIKDLRNERIERKREISAMIGGKLLEVENAKRKAIADLIDMFVNERAGKEQVADKLQNDKENETRRLFQNEVALHLEQKLAQKERQQQINMEIALKRKPLTPEEQDRPRGKQRCLEFIKETEQFMAEKIQMDRERFERETEERRQAYESYVKQMEAHDNDVENAKTELLKKSSIQLLRYFPSSVVRTDYLPQPIRDRVREAVRNDPIPILTKKRHQPHLRGHHSDEAEIVRCSKSCTNPHTISNIF